MGVMERQLGNMAILIPMLEQIQNRFPGVQMVTSLQISQEFCSAHQICSLDIPAMYKPNIWAGFVSLFDWLRSRFFRLLEDIFRVKAKFLLKGRKFKHLLECDLYLDFSGDTYGDIAYWGHFIKHSIDLSTIHNLRIPIMLYAQSPGPFSSWLRRSVGRKILNQIQVITIRESEAYRNVNRLRIDCPVIQTACPAWSLKPAPVEQVRAIVSAEGFRFFIHPLVGVNLTGFNFAENLTTSDKYKSRRPVNQITPVIEVIGYLLDELKVNVVIIPHVYRLNTEGKMIPGPDGQLSEQVYQMVNNSSIQNKERLMFIRGSYKVDEVKALIGQTDLMIAGRLHAGVGGMSQGIPTVLMAYSPKHHGFAQLAGLENYVSNTFRGSFDKADIIHKVEHLWENRTEISKQILERMDHINELISLNQEVLAGLLASHIETNQCISDESIKLWQERSYQIYQSLANTNGSSIN